VEITGADAANFLAETIQLSDGTAIAINGSARPTLDVRAGIDWAQRGGFPGNIVGGNLPQPPVFAGATGADIAIGSIANNFVDSGDIVLTAAGNIFTGNIESFSNGIGDAGSIRLTSDASVFIENSSVQSQTFGEGRGGDIKVKFPPKLAVRVTGAI
jgi:hypothetical protein